MHPAARQEQLHGHGGACSIHLSTYIVDEVHNYVGALDQHIGLGHISYYKSRRGNKLHSVTGKSDLHIKGKNRVSHRALLVTTGLSGR